MRIKEQTLKFWTLNAGTDAEPQKIRVTVDQWSSDEFFGYYKGHMLELSREDDERNWYIIVTSESGCHCYDGYWSDSEDTSVEEAVIEAIKGAGLLEPRRPRQDNGGVEG